MTEEQQPRKKIEAPLIVAGKEPGQLVEIFEGGAPDPICDREEWLSVQKRGHKGLLSMDWDAKMDLRSTAAVSYVTPKYPDERLKGIKRELYKQAVYEILREQVHIEHAEHVPEREFSSTTRSDFCVPGFVPQCLTPSREYDFLTDRPISFFSENYKSIQRVTDNNNPNNPFMRSTFFSTPLSERLVEFNPPLDN